MLLNVYVYWAVAVFVGVVPVYSGIDPYATASVFNVLPSPSFHVIVYSLIVSVNVATYSVSPVIASTVGDQPTNL